MTPAAIRLRRYTVDDALAVVEAVHESLAELSPWMPWAHAADSATRQGVATAAVHAVHAWGFEHTNLIRPEIVVATGNAASLRVAEKAGAVREGTLHRRLMLGGTAHDASVFSFTRPIATP